jgi:hypothetical protein
MALIPESPMLRSLDRDGFVVLRSVVTSTQIDALRDASQHVEKLAQAGK